MPPLSDLPTINRALRKVRLDRSTSVSSAPLRRALWAPFLGAVHQEILEGGRAALVARESGEQVQLYVEGAEGRMRGAFRDPAGIARALHEWGLERVDFEGVHGARALPLALVALLEGPFEPLEGTSLYARGDRFVERVTGAGLPEVEGLAWKAREEREPAPAARMSAREFEARARRIGRGEAILALYEGAVLEHTAGSLRAERAPYIPALLRIARRFNEGRTTWRRPPRCGARPRRPLRIPTAAAGWWRWSATWRGSAPRARGDRATSRVRPSSGGPPTT